MISMKRLITLLLALFLLWPQYSEAGTKVWVVGGATAAPVAAYNLTLNTGSIQPYNVSDSGAQTFVAAASGTLVSATVYLNNVYDGGGVLTARVGTTCDVSSSYIAEAINSINATSTGLKTFTFASGTITATQTYCLVVRNANALYVNRVDIAISSEALLVNDRYLNGAVYLGDDWVSTTGPQNYKDLYSTILVQP